MRVTIFLRVVPLIVTVATQSDRVVVRTMVVPDTRQILAYLDEMVTVVLAPAGAEMPTRDIADAAVMREAVDSNVLVCRVVLTAGGTAGLVAEGAVLGAWATDVGGAVVTTGGTAVDSAATGAAVVAGGAVVGAAVVGAEVAGTVVVGAAVKMTSTVSTAVRSTEHVVPEQPGVLHEPSSHPEPGLAESEADDAPSISTVQSSVQDEPPDLVTVPPPVTRTRSDRAGTYDADAVAVAAGVLDPGSR